jgi:hypothetical protein
LFVRLRTGQIRYNGGQTVVAANGPPGGSCKAFNV